MSWQDAHRYRAALRTAEADLDRTGGRLVWRPEYVEVFGSRARLLMALGSYWQTMVQAQVDCDYELDGSASLQIRELAAAHPGLAWALGIAGRSARAQIGGPAQTTDEFAGWRGPALVGAA